MSDSSSVGNYAAHPKLTCGSWHRLLTATAAQPQCQETKTKEKAEKYIIWAKATKATYAQHLKIELGKIPTEQILGEKPSKRDSNRYAQDIADAITAAMEKVSNKSLGRRKDQREGYIKALSNSKVMKEANIEKDKLMAKADKAITPAENKKAWDAIGRCQKRIDSIQTDHQRDRDHDFWQNMEIDHKGSNFWKHARALKPKAMPPPTLLSEPIPKNPEDDHQLYKHINKRDLPEYINRYYKEISDNKDEASSNFNEYNGHTQEQLKSNRPKPKKPWM